MKIVGVHHRVGPVAVTILLGIAASWIPLRTVQAQVPPGKHVLLLYSHENAMYSQFDAPLRLALSDELAHPVDFYTEYLDLIRFPRERYDQPIIDFLQAKYADRRIDLIVVVSPLAFDFVRERGLEVFPDIPVVFASVNTSLIKGTPLPSHMTGVAVTRDFKDTLNLALEVHPDTTLVVVPAGSSPTERSWVADARKDFEVYESRVSFSYLTGLPIDEMVDRLKTLPPHALVLFSPMLYSDSNGTYFRPEQLAKLVAASSNAPVYGTDVQFLGTGIVGGSLYDMTAVGVAAGEMGQRILAGESPANIPVRTMNPNRLMFDARQLARWNIAEDRLPGGSVVMYRPATLWNQYRGYVIATASVLLGQTALVTLLLIHRSRRYRVERALRASDAAVRAAYAEVRDLVGRLITAQESERRRIARDLHDDLSQELALLGMEIGRLGQSSEPLALDDAVRDLSERMGTIASGVHRLSHDLHPAKLEIVGLVPAIGGLCREMSLQHEMRIEFRHAGGDCDLPRDASLSLFRIVQEALHNIVKHSGARTATVRLRRTPGGLRLHVADDGRGFDNKAPKREGLGLLSMRERVLFANGTLAIRSAAGRGTHVVVTLPIDEDDDCAPRLDHARSA